MEERGGGGVKSAKSEPVLLNVYDLNKKINKYTGKLGLGLYHSGVQVWSLTVEFYTFQLLLFPIDLVTCETFIFNKFLETFPLKYFSSVFTFFIEFWVKFLEM